MTWLLMMGISNLKSYVKVAFNFVGEQHFSKSSLRQHSSCLDAKNEVRVRFAPSPTGFLHLGGLRTALYNYLFAKSRGGTFILRIEDTDQSRTVPGALENLLNILQWTHILPDEGLFHGGRFGPYVQSERLDLYREHAMSLIQGGHAYCCFCTPKRLDLLRKDSARTGHPPRYDNRCRHLSRDDVDTRIGRRMPYIVRLKLFPTPEPWDDLVKGPTSHNVADVEGDPVILKSDGFPTYHLANVVDDHYMGITHVLRGEEWQSSTPKHILLYNAFGWHFPRFAHLPLIMNTEGRKLSKRQSDIHIDHLKNEGYLPDAILSYITTIGGGFTCDTSSLTLSELVSQFRLNGVKRYNSRLDKNALDVSNLHHMRRIMAGAGSGGLVLDLRALLTETHHIKSAPATDILNEDYLLHILKWALSQGRINKMTDLVGPDLAFIWQTLSADQAMDLLADVPNLKELLSAVDNSLEYCCQAQFNEKTLSTTLKHLAKMLGMNHGVFMPMMRTVLTGMQTGPPVSEVMAVIGRAAAKQRIRNIINMLN